MAVDRAVRPAADNEAILDYNCADWHFALRGSCTRKIKGFVHHFAGFGQGHVILLAQITAFDHTST